MHNINKKFYDFMFKHIHINRPIIEIDYNLKENLRRKIIKLNNTYAFDNSSLGKWNNNLYTLVNNIIHDNIDSFLNWKVIKSAMFHESRKIELDYLLKDNQDFWKQAIKESWVGNPKPYFYYRESSGNLIHHAYSLKQLIKNREQIENIDFVFEFGGGYGSMCRLFKNLGFKGRYVIFDFIEFNYIQEMFLKSCKIRNISYKIEDQKAKIFLLNNLNDLNNLIKKYKHTDLNSLFIATWSISEVPLSLRSNIFETIGNFKNYIIAYQKEFFELDNELYFSKFIKNMKDTKWSNYEINHLKNNYYLIGRYKKTI